MDEIYTIMQRLALIEGSITPTNVKQGLNSQQKSVPQMPALYKMPSQGPVLGGNPNKKTPGSGYMVGSDEGVEHKEEMLEEEVTSEDKLDKVKKSFADYLDSIADEKKDTDLKDKVDHDSDIKEKDTKDSSIIAKQITAVSENPTEEDPIVQMPTPPVENPIYAESAPVKTIALEDGRACEIHGDERRGFEIRHNGRSMKSRFKNLDQAQMALEMYVARNQQQDESADYIEEA
jgi:hypothetical protein